MFLEQQAVEYIVFVCQLRTWLANDRILVLFMFYKGLYNFIAIGVVNQLVD